MRDEVIVFRDVEVDGRRVDVRVEAGVVVAVDEGLGAVGARVVDGGGGALLPGLHDHHTHLLATAAAEASVRVGPGDVDGAGGLAAALRDAAHRQDRRRDGPAGAGGAGGAGRGRTRADGTNGRDDADGARGADAASGGAGGSDGGRPGGGDGRAGGGRWVRAVGYHESVAGDLDRAVLDAAVGDRPVRVQHRSGALWVLNGAALAAIGPLRPLPGEPTEPTLGEGPGVDPFGVERTPDGEPTGRFFRADGWLSHRWPDVELDLGSLGRRLLAHGVTGVTDATPFTSLDGPERLARAVVSGELPQRVVATGSPLLASADLPTGLGRGPVKLLLPDHDLPPVGVVVAWVHAAHDAGRSVAVHCVTAEALVVTMAALAEAGPWPGPVGDRIEHGAVVPAGLIPDLAGLGVTVVTQPNFVAERGDAYRRDVEPHEHADLWRCASLRDGGVAVAAGTDAPYGDPDPWRAVAAAVGRRTASGAPFGPGEALTPDRALALFLGPADAPGGPSRRVTPGAPADLCLLHVPLSTALSDPSSTHVRQAFASGP